MKKSIIIIVVFTILTFGCKKNTKIEKVTLPEKQESVDITSQISNELNSFVGVWSTSEQNPIVELAIKNGQFEIKECYGLNAKKGLIYSGKYEKGKVIAVGNEKDFYKWTLPTFEFEGENMNSIKFNSGAGPFELIKTDKLMPNISYDPPKNND